MELSSNAAIDVSSYLDIAVTSPTANAHAEATKHQPLSVHTFETGSYEHSVDGIRSFNREFTSPPSMRSWQVCRSDGDKMNDVEKGKGAANGNCASEGPSTADVARIQEQVRTAPTDTSNSTGTGLPTDLGVQNGNSTSEGPELHRVGSVSSTSAAAEEVPSASTALHTGSDGSPAHLTGSDTPQGKGSDSSASKSAQKTPTFPNELSDSPSKPRRNRRRRADTPHPVSGDIDSNTTTPQTTPEKPSKPPRKRRPRRANGGRVSSGQITSDITVGSDSPLARKSTKKPRQKKVPREKPQQEGVALQTLSDVKTGSAADSSVTGPIDLEGKKSTPVDALSVEIDYPSFQTIAILEFEPDFLQQQSTQATQTGIESETTQVDETDVKTQLKQRGTTRRRQFRRRIPIIKKQKPKRPVKAGTCPILMKLFARYALEFTSEIRPYLQYATLEREALERDPQTDVTSLREEFQKAYQQDSKGAWDTCYFKASPIDDYFARSERNVPSFRYVPTAEATEEFVRLSLEAGWIKERPPQWDVDHWDASLERYEKLWEGKEAKKQRRRFRNACFWEFDQYLGHIFFEIRGILESDGDEALEGEYLAQARSDEPELKKRLEDCRRFLDHFGDFSTASLEECQEFIDHNLNVNLYDLLHWLRNPRTAIKPQRFANVRDLGIYSYEQNKVFPRFRANESYIASPLLRSIGYFARPHRKIPTDSDKEWESNVWGSPGNVEFTEASPKGTDDVVGGETSGVTADNEPMEGTGASLFNPPEGGGQQTSSRNTGRSARKRRGAVSSKYPSKDMSPFNAGDVVAVAA